MVNKATERICEQISIFTRSLEKGIPYPTVGSGYSVLMRIFLLYYISGYNIIKILYEKNLPYFIKSERLTEHSFDLSFCYRNSN